jgi:hypothetical protein
MPEISPSEVIANIERAIAEGTIPPPEETRPDPSSLLTEYPEPDDPRQLFKTLERGPLLEMREREAVDRPAGTGLLHRIFARITRQVAVPQARYNHHTRQASDAAVLGRSRHLREDRGRGADFESPDGQGSRVAESCP